MPRICISTLVLRPGRTGSSEPYLVNLVRALRETNSDNEYVVFVTPQNEYLFGSSDASCRLVRTPVSVHSRAVRMFWDHAVIPMRARQMGAEVLHYPATVAAPMATGEIPQVVTVHYDLDSDHKMSIGLAKRLYYRAMVVQSCRRARAVVVPSQAFAASFATRWNVPIEKLKVVHHGVQVETAELSAPVRMSLERAGVVSRYLLCVTNALPHKNVLCLLEAYALLVRRLREAIPLVLTGAISDGAWRRWLRALADRAIQIPVASVIRTGFLGLSDTGALYRGAALLVTPTLTESFSMPVVEAMAYGCPVVASDIPVHREIGLDAPLLVRRGDASALAEACQTVLLDRETRDAMIARGLRRAAQFSWKRTAARMISVYAEASAS
jgi:glycosyltransferase involved in cell wall biosynthesis